MISWILALNHLDTKDSPQTSAGHAAERSLCHGPDLQHTILHYYNSKMGNSDSGLSIVKRYQIKQALRSSCELLRPKDSKLLNLPWTFPEHSLTFSEPFLNLPWTFPETSLNLQDHSLNLLEPSRTFRNIQEHWGTFIKARWHLCFNIYIQYSKNELLQITTRIACILIW